MSTIILSCGRTGTNMLLEILAGSEKIDSHISPLIERNIFRVLPLLPPNYLTKSDTHYIENLWTVSDMMLKNSDLKILWPIRDLRDCALSKIFRGRPKGLGNDQPADDATLLGCIEDIDKMTTIYDLYVSTFLIELNWLEWRTLYPNLIKL